MKSIPLNISNTPVARLRKARWLIAAFLGLLLAGCSSPEEQLAEYLASANALFAEGDYEKAGVQFRNALEIDQKNVEAWYGLAQVSSEQGNVQAAFDQHTTVTELDATHLPAQLFVARVLLASKQLDKALEKSELLLQLAPDDAEAHAFRAAVAYQLADLEGAVAEANLALAIDVNNIQALTVLAAERLAAEDPQAALEYLDRGLSAEQGNAPLGLIKISILHRQKDVDAAVAVFEKLLSYRPEDQELHYTFARYLVANGRMDEAEKVFAKIVASEPDDVEPKLMMVRFLLQHRGLEPAMAQLDAYVQENPKDYDLRFGRAELYTAAGQKEKAEAEYRSIVSEAETSPDGLKARNRLAGLALGDGDQATAEDLVREVLAADVRNVQGLILRAGLRAQNEQYDDAVSDLRAALGEEPGSAQALVLLARIHEKLDQSSLANDYYARAIEANPQQSPIALEYARSLIREKSISKADKVLEDLLERSPNLLPAMKLQARVKLSLQQWAAAQTLAERIKAADSTDESVNQILGLALQGQEKHEQSIAALLEAHKASPDAAEPMTALVRAYVQSGRRDEAKDFLKAVVRADEDNYVAHFLLGRVYAAEPDLPAAEAAFVKAVEIDPRRAPGHQALGEIYRLQGDQEKSVSAFEAGVTAVPDSAGLKVALAGAYERRGDLEAAIPLYEQVLEKLPDQPLARNNLASILSETKGDPSRLERALTLAEPLADSEVPHFRDTLGWIYHKLGRNDEALAILEDVVREEPGLGVFHYHLGMSYLEQGDTEKARASLEQAVALGERSPFMGYDESKKALESM